MKPWIENELKGCKFPDVRLGKRLKTIIRQLATGIGRSLPFACQDWANTKAAKTHFLVRTSVNRLAGDGTHTINDEMCDEPVKAVHHVQVVNRKGVNLQATLEIRYRRILVCPPIGKLKRYSSLSLTVIHAQERGKPKDRDPIDWKLVTDLPVTNRREVIEKLDWYAMRWKIETFYKVMKSGCKAEESKLRTVGRLTNLMAIFCIIAWRVFWLCTINRISPNSTAKNVFTKTEMRLLDHLFPVKDKSHKNTVKKYLTLLAKLGEEFFTKAGYRNYAEDLLERMTNPYLGDTTVRAGRDPIRKLGYDDRIFGTMRLTLEYGIEPVNMAVGAAAGLYYLLTNAEENKLPEHLRFTDWQNLTQEQIGQLLTWLWHDRIQCRLPELLKLTHKCLEKIAALSAFC